MGDGKTCPTCGRDDFKNRAGMKQHHARAHGESLSMKGVECDSCGSEFKKRADHVEKFDHHFCDEACEGEWRSGYLEGENSPRWSRVETECHQCGETIHVEKSKFEARERNFCTDGCLAAWRGKRMSARMAGRFGEVHPKWRGGHERYYGPSWDRQRRNALERDGHQCTVCGMTSAEHLEERGQDLHVHHITPFRKYGLEGHERANRLENLVTLCQRHHTQWEGLNLRPQTGGATEVPADE